VLEFIDIFLEANGMPSDNLEVPGLFLCLYCSLL